MIESAGTLIRYCSMKKRRYRPIPAAAVPIRAQEWPRAYALLCNAATWIPKTLYGLAIGAGLVMFVPPLGLLVICVCGLASIGLAALRIFLIATYFCRYSLAQLTGVYLAASFCVSLLMVFPGEYKLLPGVALAFVIMLAGGYIIAQDPQGDNFLPPFVREKMIERRRLMRERVKKAAANDANAALDAQNPPE